MYNDEQFATSLEQRSLLSVARQEIEQLRRWYAHATDLLGRTHDAEARLRATNIYKRIFTSDVEASVVGGVRALKGTGPEAWKSVATQALEPFVATQHLIGSQVVWFERVVFAGDALQEGQANMLSYVRAAHVWPNRMERVVLGTYQDAVVLVPEVGWQIRRMVLEFASEEHRQMGELT